MRKVNLNMTEQYKYEIIKKLVDTNGNKNNAALKLNCTLRHIYRLIKGYKSQGKVFFLHGNRDRQPIHTLPSSTKHMIIDLYRTKYLDANFTHFCELLASHDDISVSVSSVRQILMEEGILSPKATRATKKRMRKLLQAKQSSASSMKDIAKIKQDIMLLDEVHPRRPRCAFLGEMIQMDASFHLWFGAYKSTLHVAIDDCTGAIVGAFFDQQETLNGYYNVLNQILTDFGIPYMFYTDRRTVFEYKYKKSPSIEEDTFTQFGYACKQLGIEIKTTSIPQAKGRVERLFQTLQSRLPLELRLAGVTSPKQANIFLNSYIKEYNARFALPTNNSKSVFEKQPSKELINLTLAILSQRKVDNGHCIRYKNKYYKVIDSAGYPTYYHKGTSCMVIEAFDQSLFGCIHDKTYVLEEIPSHEHTSRNFDFKGITSKPKKRYTPPMSHPWRQPVFKKFINNQNYHNQGSFKDISYSQALRK